MPRVRAAVALGLAFAAAAAWAQSAESVLKDAHLLGPSESVLVRAAMVIDAGTTTSRTIELSMVREENGAARVLAQVIEPGFLRNLKFLMHRDERGRSDFWMRTSTGTRRLTGRDQSASVFSSDFTVEDFSYVDAAIYDLSFATSSDPGVVVVEGRLLTPLPTHSSKVFHINRSWGLIERVEYLDPAGEVVKEYRLLSVQHVGGQAYPLEASMTNHREGTSTRITITSIDPAARIPARVFNPAAL